MNRELIEHLKKIANEMAAAPVAPPQPQGMTKTQKAGAVIGGLAMVGAASKGLASGKAKLNSGYSAIKSGIKRFTS